MIFTRLIFITFCVEVILFGAGGWLQIFGIALRKLIFLLVILVLLRYILFVKPQVFSANSVTWLMFLGFFLIWGIYIPIYYDRSLATSFADFSPLLGLCIIPPLSEIYREGDLWKKDRRFIFLALNILAIFHVVAFLYGSISMENGNELVTLMRQVLEPDVDVENSSIYIGYTPEGLFRVHWGPSVFLFLGLYFAADRIKIIGFSWFSFALVILQLAAIVATQSRGIWSAVIVGGVVFYFGVKFFPKKDIALGLFLCLSAIFCITFFLIPFYSPDFLSAIGLNREGSDDVRMEQASLLLEQITKYPILGFGFGGGIDLVRSDAATFAYEVSILALYMKLGFIGLIWAFLLTFFLIGYLMQKSRLVLKEKTGVSLIYAVAFGFIYSSNSNPYLTNFFGMLILTILLIELRVVVSSNRNGG
jgi:hypothetical protein